MGDNTFHDHGDLWHGPWEWSVEEDDGETATVALRRYAVSLPCLMEKWVTLEREGLEVTFRHRLTNLGTQPVQFAWNLHVAHAIGPDSRIHLPVEAVTLFPNSRAASVAPRCRCSGRCTTASTWPRCSLPRRG